LYTISYWQQKTVRERLGAAGGGDIHAVTRAEEKNMARG
jgi:hypothetical protein